MVRRPEVPHALRTYQWPRASQLDATAFGTSKRRDRNEQRQAGAHAVHHEICFSREGGPLIPARGMAGTLQSNSRSTE